MLSMTFPQLIASLLNIGAQTNAFNSNSAAREFWLIFAVGVVIVVAAFAIRSARTPRPPRLRHHH
jgi:hypothetical protein